MTQRSSPRDEGEQRVDVDRLVDELELNAEEIEWRKEFVEFDAEDAQRVAAFEELFDQRAPEVAERFYDHVTAFEQTSAVLDRTPKTVDELEETQQAYLRTLTSGEYDEDYFANRARIGKLHERLDMPMKHYIGQYSVYYGFLFDIVTERIQDQFGEVIERHCGESTVDTDKLTRGLCDALDEQFDELHSLFKLLNLDMQVAIDTYIQSYVEDIAFERDRFAALFKNVPTPVVVVRITDDGLRVEQVNTAFRTLFGYTAEDLADQNFEQYLAPPGEEPRPVEDRGIVHSIETSSESALSEAEVTLETQFGRREFIRVSAPVERHEDDLEYAFYIDVTDQKQRQERLQVLSRVLRHDIRNKTNVITGCAAACRDHIDDERPEELLDLIDKSADTLVSTSEQIRQVEQLVAGTADRREMDLVRVAKETVETVQKQYPDCTFTVAAEGAVRVEGMGALDIAVEELVENAAQHNDADSPRVEVSVTASLDEQYAALRVADNGPGIPPEEYEVLTGERDHSQTNHMSGLGLWTVNWILTRAGGSLHFAANSPRGSIVTVRLPLQ